MKQLLVIKSNIPEIKKICEERGINYEIQTPRKPKIKLSEQEVKAGYEKLTTSKNYEKEMKAWDAIEEDE